MNLRDRGATQPPAHFHRNPPGCADFGWLFCRSSVKDRSGYSPSSLRTASQTWLQRCYSRYTLGALVVCLLGWTSVSVLAETGTVQVAAAADLVYCLDELTTTFHQQQPSIDLKLTTGSSGNFFTQIEQGAPFDVFLSADVGYPKKLVTEGLAPADSLFVYANGKIALWTTKPDAVPVAQGLNILADSQRVVKIAIANPDHAPYGRAAKAALEKAGLWTAVQPRLVLGENIAQTAQFVQTGNADCGIVALSLLLGPKLKGVGTYQIIDPNLYPPLEQAAVLTRSGAANAAARTYLDFLRSAAARKIFDRYGFTIPASGS